MVPEKHCGCSESDAWMDGSLFDTEGIDRALDCSAVERSIDGRGAVERIDDSSSTRGLPPSHKRVDMMENLTKNNRIQWILERRLRNR